MQLQQDPSGEGQLLERCSPQLWWRRQQSFLGFIQWQSKSKHVSWLWVFSKLLLNHVWKSTFRLGHVCSCRTWRWFLENVILCLSSEGNLGYFTIKQILGDFHFARQPAKQKVQLLRGKRPCKQIVITPFEKSMLNKHQMLSQQTSKAFSDETCSCSFCFPELHHIMWHLYVTCQKIFVETRGMVGRNWTRNQEIPAVVATLH